MSRAWWLGLILCAGIAAVGVSRIEGQTKKKEVIQYVETDSGKWMVHDESRPAPPVIEPGTYSTEESPGSAPSDAIVLLTVRSSIGPTARAARQSGYRERIYGVGQKRRIRQKQAAFGSCQLHVSLQHRPPSAERPGHGNSGVFARHVRGQVLDSFDNKTYPDGRYGALYGRRSRW
jgi:hypothetical protein